jgi:hypothetical protein
LLEGSLKSKPTWPQTSSGFAATSAFFHFLFARLTMHSV